MVTTSVLKTEAIKSCHVTVMLFGLARLGQFQTHSGLEAVIVYGKRDVIVWGHQKAQVLLLSSTLSFTEES